MNEGGNKTLGLDRRFYVVDAENIRSVEQGVGV